MLYQGNSYGYNPYNYNPGNYNQYSNYQYAGNMQPYVQPTQPVPQPNAGNQPQLQQQGVQGGSMLPGKIVESIDVVSTMDIPMDGNTYYFPKADGTEIYTKKWLPNITTQIDTYIYVNKDAKAKNEAKQENTLSEGIAGLAVVLKQMGSEMQDKMSAIDTKIAKLEKTINAAAKTKQDAAK